MPFVLDASVALAWAFPDERHALADAAWERVASDEGMTPALWWFEVRNALLMGERRGRIDPAGTASFLQLLARLPIATDRAPEEAVLLDLARRHRLTVYDAAYLELAQRRGIALATMDRALVAAAPPAGVTLLAAP